MAPSAALEGHAARQIGKYKIVGKIGQGAMGEVYKAHDAVLNRMVAIKTITADLGSDETLRKRFQREAQSAARLNHPNIITVYDYSEERNRSRPRSPRDLALLLGSAGVKVNPVGRLLLMANLLFAIGDSGLQGKVTPVFGIDYSF